MNRPAGADLAGMVVVITGGAGDIGSAVAAAFIGCGASVVVCDADEEGARVTASELGPKSRAVQLDVTNDQQVQLAVSQILESNGRIDVLVNAAGILGRTPLGMDPSVDEWDQVFAVNTRGTYSMMRAVAPAMIRDGSGAVVNVASVAAKEGRGTYLPYGASKAAVLNLTWSAARVLAPHGVTVNAICPGPVDGRMWASVATAVDRETGSAPGTARAQRESQLPLGRFASLSDVAEAIMFFADPRHRYFTGISLDVAGGSRLGFGS